MAGSSGHLGYLQRNRAPVDRSLRTGLVIEGCLTSAEPADVRDSARKGSGEVLRRDLKERLIVDALALTDETRQAASYRRSRTSRWKRST